jgi:NhaA family Na+:H+ antiporter
MLSSNMVLDMGLVRNIIICLVIGNSVGITSLILIGKKLKLVQLPIDITMWHIVGVSFLAGVGFTMAIFVANLAFADAASFVDSAKIGILIGSLISAVIGFIVLRIAPKKISKEQLTGN